MIKLQKYDGAFEPTIIDYIIAFFTAPFLVAELYSGGFEPHTSSFLQNYKDGSCRPF